MLGLGIDVGTSGVRVAAVDGAGRVAAEARTPLAREPAREGAMAGDARAVDAESWWRAAERTLDAALDTLGARRAEVGAIAVDGTSGSVVLVDADARPVTAGLLYDAGGFEAEGACIDGAAPPASIARGANSALARVLRLAADAPDARALCHQADFVAARLLGRPGLSDESNALKTGYDPRARRWPDWIAETGLSLRLLPEVRPVGAALGPVAPAMCRRLGLPEGALVVAGASDGTAAFLGATDGEAAPGTAVTSLGTTLTLKVASARPVEDVARGVYSHRVGDAWLPGGASNTGGGALLTRFPPERIAALSERIDPRAEPAFDAYPLAAPGERFPLNDPDLAPRMGPAPTGDPDRDAAILHALLHAVARIERAGYETLHALGAPLPTRVLTSGGGAANAAWTAMRERILGVPIEAAAADPAIGMARLALRAL